MSNAIDELLRRGTNTLEEAVELLRLRDAERRGDLAPRMVSDEDYQRNMLDGEIADAITLLRGQGYLVAKRKVR